MNTVRCLALCAGMLLSTPLSARQNPAAKSSAPGDGIAIATLMTVNDHEIKAAELALSKDIGASAKQYATMMDAQHTDNQNKTRALAITTKPVDDADLRALRQKTAAARSALAKLDGAAFETAYVDAMVKDHAEVLAKLDTELIPGATDADVIMHLKATREHVAAHLDAARKLAVSPRGNADD